MHMHERCPPAVGLYLGPYGSSRGGGYVLSAPTVGLCLGPYSDPRGGSISYQRLVPRVSSAVRTPLRL